MSTRPARTLILIASATTLVWAIAAILVFAGPAAALPCQTCGDGSDPPLPPDPPVYTTETVHHSVSVATERGRVTDGAAIDCPSGSCTRSLAYSVRCVDGDCPPFSYATVTLTLTPVAGFSATWDGCTPHAADPALCDVLVDADRTVTVHWTADPTGGGGVSPTPVHDGGPTTPPGGGTAGGGKAGGGATGTRTVVTEAPSGRARPGAIRSTIRYSFRRAVGWTEFTLFKVRHLPPGATVAVGCVGRGCPRDRELHAGGRALTLGKLTGRRFRPGTRITVRVSKPGKRAHTALIRVRRGKDPLITHPR